MALCFDLSLSFYRPSGVETLEGGNVQMTLSNNWRCLNFIRACWRLGKKCFVRNKSTTVWRSDSRRKRKVMRQQVLFIKIVQTCEQNGHSGNGNRVEGLPRGTPQVERKGCIYWGWWTREREGKSDWLSSRVDFLFLSELVGKILQHLGKCQNCFPGLNNYEH